MQTLNEARDLVDRICEQLNYDTYIILQWNDRYRTRFGTAHLKQKTISISSYIWNLATIEERIQVVYHEVAHIIAYDRYGDRGHGWQWKMVMRQLGRTPDRCHSIVNGTRRGPQSTTLFTSCNGCNTPIKIGSSVQKRIRLGRVYRCVKCKARIDNETLSTVRN